MPQPRKYEDQAARQRAYRARMAAQGAPRSMAGAPGYVKWRRAVAEAYTLLQATYDELGEWMQERSDRWQDSDRAGELEADKDKLYEAMESLAELAVLGREVA